VLTLTVALAKELSGEAAVERAATTCCASEANCENAKVQSQEEIYVQETERRFNGSINRCC
ncbi:MAG: hypothetical protein ABIR24_08115, partial [Verrucomicrobiota bacterium]